jgi:hypothetical protein
MFTIEGMSRKLSPPGLPYSCPLSELKPLGSSTSRWFIEVSEVRSKSSPVENIQSYGFPVAPPFWEDFKYFSKSLICLDDKYSWAGISGFV